MSTRGRQELSYPLKDGGPLSRSPQELCASDWSDWKDLARGSPQGPRRSRSDSSGCRGPQVLHFGLSFGHEPPATFGRNAVLAAPMRVPAICCRGGIWKKPSREPAQVSDDTNLQPGVAALRDMLFLSCVGMILVLLYLCKAG